MRRSPLHAYILVSLLSLSGCATLGAMDAVSNYQSLASQVSIGDSKEKALKILLPGQDNIGKYKRAPEMFAVENDGGGKRLIEIYYLLSSVPEHFGVVTDEDYTPYVFKDGVLSSIGWTALGGPKSTRAQVKTEMMKAWASKPEVNVNVENPQMNQMPQMRSTTCRNMGLGTVRCDSF